ncbi:MAG: endonuclease V [Bacteroidota bacterium]
MPLVLRHAHPWNLSPREAIAVQQQLAGEVRQESLAERPATIAGLDVSVRGDQVRAAAVVTRTDTWAPVATALWEGPVAFPYVPGLLSFREVPALLPVLERLVEDHGSLPDVLMLDGHGLAHPRRFGLACHLGVLLDRPTLGVAKKRFVGTHDEPGALKGAQTPLVHREETIGTVLRTRSRVKPVFVSVGHRLTLTDAVALTLEAATRTKLPEPTRLAHRLSYRGAL